MQKTINFLAGCLLGAALGAGLVILFAPQSGAETQQFLKDQFKDVIEEANKAREQTQADLKEQLAKLKER
jgi:gas vesicle protein